MLITATELLPLGKQGLMYVADLALFVLNIQSRGRPIMPSDICVESKNSYQNYESIPAYTPNETGWVFFEHLK